MAGWQAKIVAWHEDEAEIRVSVDYHDSDDEWKASEIIVEPAGTPEARVLEEIGRRGRQNRARYSREHRGDNPNVGRTFGIDDL